MTARRLETTITSFLNKHSTILPNWLNDWSVFWVLICRVHLIGHSYHVTYAFQREWTLYIFLNIKELLCSNMRYIWSLSDCNRTRTQNLLLCKQTLSHLAKLVEWLSCVFTTYLYGTFNCMFLSCHVRISEWIHIIYLPECQGTQLLRASAISAFSQSRRDILSLGDCNGSRTHKNLLWKGTLNRLASLADWFSCVVSAFLGGAFDCMFLSWHQRISKGIHILCFPECLGTVLFKTGAISEGLVTARGLQPTTT